jgi:hypothetical protein
MIITEQQPSVKAVEAGVVGQLVDVNLAHRPLH